ncbi:MAG: GTPase HflX [Candidatus Omnitrophica bacterium]|nr:GTPase HflX [Candidatus Omnitrophota bacterium]
MTDTKYHNTQQGPERAVIVVVELTGRESWPLEDRIEELSKLTASCGVVVAEKVIAKRHTYTPELFIGKGKAEEILTVIEENNINVVIFSNELSPSQQKNLEKIFNIKVIDRTQLILDVFARRAKSDEGKMQVELAQLEYLMPRLSKMWEHIYSQQGGVGMRGPGEQQLEVDRRRIREKISRLKKLLKEKTKHRNLRRAERGDFSNINIALVGYTNSGKSTLFNALTSADVLAKDQLFSTLDPVVRKFILPTKQVVLLSDTVGFMHDLPHDLIESFKATLEEVVNADLLFHVVDVSAPRMEQEFSAVLQVLEELEAQDKPVITILNKIDKIENENDLDRLKKQFGRPVAISALEKTNLVDLTDRVVQHIQGEMEEIDIVLPPSAFSFINTIREKGVIRSEKYNDEGHLHIRARLPKRIKYAILKKIAA